MPQLLLEIQNRAHPSLLKYRRVLTPNDWAALRAWFSTFKGFQLAWLLELCDYAICLKARQTGFSHTTAAVGVLWGAIHGELTTIISVGDREAKEVLTYAKRHARVLVQLGCSLARIVKENAEEIVFASGGRIMALPGTGGRGFSGNMVLDEYAYAPHAAKVWDAAAAVTTLGGRLRVVSTPNGIGNDFEQLWTGVQKGEILGYKPYLVTLDDAIAQGYPVDLAKCWTMAKGDPRIFDQWFRCKFLDNDLQYIPSDLFARRFFETVSDEGVAYGGLDIGEKRDRTTLAIVKRQGDRRTLVHIESHKLTDDDLLDRLAAKAIGTYGCQRLALDKTGLGIFPAKRMKRTYGSKVEQVDFNLTSKEDLATGLYDAVQTEELQLPRSYIFNGIDEMPALRDDVYSIRRIVTAAGNVRYDAPRTTKGHADSAWALMLALHAAGRMSRMYAALQKSTQPKAS